LIFGFGLGGSSVLIFLVVDHELKNNNYQFGF